MALSFLYSKFISYLKPTEYEIRNTSRNNSSDNNNNLSDSLHNEETIIHNENNLSVGRNISINNIFLNHNSVNNNDNFIDNQESLKIPVNLSNNNNMHYLPVEQKVSIANALISGTKISAELAEEYQMKISRVNYFARKVRLGLYIAPNVGRPLLIDDISDNILRNLVIELNQQNNSKEEFRRLIRIAIKKEFVCSYCRHFNLSQLNKKDIPKISTSSLKKYIKKYTN
jgi:hypothetical protein